MNAAQRQSIFFLYLRDDEALPRGAMRMQPVMDRRGTDDKESLDSFVALMKFCKFNKDVYINLFSDWQKHNRVYDILFFDIDNEDLVESQHNTLQIILALRRIGIKHYNVYFSGSKGFHVYVRFEPTYLNSYRTAVMGFLRKYNLSKYVDIATVEPNRLTRVPYSINGKSGLRCVPVQDLINVEMDDLIIFAGTDKVVEEKVAVVNDGLGALLKELDSDVVDSDNSYQYTKNMFLDEEHYPDCMKELTQQAMDGEHLNHTERLELAKFLVAAYDGNLEVVEKYFKAQENYSSSKTMYHLRYVANRNLKMMKCEGLLDCGICPYKDAQEQKSKCPFYPTVNHFLFEDAV